jgi:hypothetical protein
MEAGDEEAHPRQARTVLERVNGIATVEPRVLNPQDGAYQRRGDNKVSKHGNTWILDVGVVCRRSGATSTRAVAHNAIMDMPCLLVLVY